MTENQEYQYQNIYNFEYCKILLDQFSKNWSYVRFSIPLKIFDVSIQKSLKLAYLLKINFETYLEKLNKNQFVIELFENELLFLDRENLMKKKVTVRIPYADYSLSYKYLLEINKLVSHDGITTIFANNIPYDLEFGIVIETKQNFDEILLLTKKYGYEIDYSFGFYELLKGASGIRYNFTDLGIEATLDSVIDAVERIVLFVSKDTLSNQGYIFNKPEKKKVFISYSHKNKDEVTHIVNELQSSGLQVWWDMQDIEFGDSIMENIQQGISESHLYLIFLSKNTMESMNAREELKTFYNKIIQSRDTMKKWFIVRLDTVDPSELFLNLGDYKYFDMPEHTSDKLGKAISKKLKKIKPS